MSSRSSQLTKFSTILPLSLIVLLFNPSHASPPAVGSQYVCNTALVGDGNRFAMVSIEMTRRGWQLETLVGGKDVRADLTGPGQNSLHTRFLIEDRSWFGRGQGRRVEGLVFWMHQVPVKVQITHLSYLPGSNHISDSYSPPGYPISAASRGSVPVNNRGFIEDGENGLCRRAR